MQAQQKAMMLELLAAVLHSWWTIVGGICAGLAVGITVLHMMPEIYEATTRFVVRPQQIPEQLVRTTVSNDNPVPLDSCR